jgi:pimeloyl-ACP methyl ester carboxylesterase
VSAGFAHHLARLREVTLHYVICGSGSPLLLLHGWPQTWYAWRAVMRHLQDRYLLVAPDLRGLGESSRPAQGYDIASVAGDLGQLMAEELGCPRYAVAGHDWGGPVAYALAARERVAVTHLAVLDVTIPGDGRAAGTNQGGRRWHHAFHQVPELPEALVAGREEHYLGWFYRNFGARSDALAPAAIEEYLRHYRDPAALRAGFAYYRNIPISAAFTAGERARGKLDMPVLALGGRDGWGRGDETAESCRQVAHHVTGRVIDQAGHWLLEEQPAQVAAALAEFLAREA